MRPVHETIHYQHHDGSPHLGADCPLLAVQGTATSVRVENDTFTRRDGRLTLITQPDHAALAGRMAESWGNEHFATPAARDALISAAVHHDDGWLHQFTPVFNGIPAEVRTGGWPVQVNPGSPTALASPVYDPVSGNVFLADIGGFLYRVDSGATATVSGQLDFSSAEGGAGIVQGPIVDASAELVYVFSSSDGSTACAGGAACAAVYQFGVDFTGATFGTKVTVGASTLSGSAPNPLYLGAFDSTYKNSVNATGNLYVCGDTGGFPALFQ